MCDGLVPQPPVLLFGNGWKGSRLWNEKRRRTAFSDEKYLMGMTHLKSMLLNFLGFATARIEKEEAQEVVATLNDHKHPQMPLTVGRRFPPLLTDIADRAIVPLLKLLKSPRKEEQEEVCDLPYGQLGQRLQSRQSAGQIRRARRVQFMP
jgi:hypothetical protein